MLEVCVRLTDGGVVGENPVGKACTHERNGEGLQWDPIQGEYQKLGNQFWRPCLDRIASSDGSPSFT